VTGQDPFEVLGLEPSASSGEIASAYRQLARKHHPDQHPGATSEQRAVHEARMAEINAAHRSIQDGWRPSTVPKPQRARPAKPRVTPPPPPTPGPNPEIGEPEGGEPVSPWKVFAVLGAATIGLLAIIGIVVAVISPESTTTPSEDQPEVVDVGSWTIGTCVTDGASAEAVRCEFPHRGMVIADVFNAAQCPALTDAYVADPPRLLCIDLDL
jgi:hypothetical protein